MEAAALSNGSGVLVSFWRPTQLAVTYGTQIDWIDKTVAPVIELYCHCQPHIAQHRFVNRERHSGHNDALRMESLIQKFDELATLGPLGFWPLATVNTDSLDDLPALQDEAVKKIQALLKSAH